MINDAVAPRRRRRQPSVRAVVGAGSEVSLIKTLNPQNEILHVGAGREEPLIPRHQAMTWHLKAAVGAGSGMSGDARGVLLLQGDWAEAHA